MKRSIFVQFFCIVLLMVSDPARSFSVPSDSLGIRTIGGRSFILHKVEKGETLYRLSRRYAVDVSDIVDVNPNSDRNLQVGQELRIPCHLAVTADAEGNRIEHVVRAGETLYGIAGKYNVSINDIKKWNSLRSNSLSIGERLTINLSVDAAAQINAQKNNRENNGKKIHIVNRGETLFSIANHYDISTDDMIKWNRLKDNSIYVGQELVVGFTDNRDETVEVMNDLQVEKTDVDEVEVMKKPVEGTPMIRVENAGQYKKVSEKGIARVIEGSEETKKYLALHRSAPIGTIMQVKNEMNDLSVFVRVIGKLPETDENNNILLKISKTAYDRLGAYDNQFPVEIVYHP